MVLFCYLPLNLAWLCATSSTLGSLGSRANLSDDSINVASIDGTNPYVSALLRGFFVYLFMTSGLLLLDETPFSSPSPGQYIRLAGFLSLFSFVLSYQPQLFTALIDSAFQRIQVRGRERDHETSVTESAVVSRRQETETRAGRSRHKAGENRRLSQLVSVGHVRSFACSERRPWLSMNQAGDAAGRLSRFRQKARVCWLVRYAPTFEP